MSKVDISYTDYFSDLMRWLSTDGVFLVSQGKDAKPNVMTIGWGTVGWIWGCPMFVVLVRPSRYTHGLIEEAGDFTVNVVPRSLKKALEFCGTISGRNHDKFREQGLTPVASRKVSSPIIQQCVLHYECKVVQKTDVNAAAFLPEISDTYYPKGDFHRIYFGEIVAAYADSDAGEKL
jgi:flavin reductase (DIM6/NTAB) family NADH-FMN oxidoreductase RutF